MNNILSLKSILLAVLMGLTLFNSAAEARGPRIRIRWPRVEIPAPHIPPVTEWKLGGDFGKVIQTYKGALGVLGSILGGDVAGITEHEKRSAVLVLEQMNREAEIFRQASEKFPAEAGSIVRTYDATSSYLGRKNAPDEAFSKLRELYMEAGRCLYSSSSQDQADGCLDHFDDQVADLKQIYH